MTAAHGFLAFVRNTKQLLSRRNLSFWTVLRTLSFFSRRIRVPGSCTRSCDSYQRHRRDPLYADGLLEARTALRRDGQLRTAADAFSFEY